MKNRKEREEMFRQDPLIVRLRKIAADVGRIPDLVRDPDRRHAVETILDETRGPIEWTLPEALAIPRAGVELANLMRALTSWLGIWREERLTMNLQVLLEDEMMAWSDRIQGLADAPRLTESVGRRGVFELTLALCPVRESPPTSPPPPPPPPPSLRRTLQSMIRHFLESKP